MAGSWNHWHLSSLALILCGTIGCGSGAPPANITTEEQPPAAAPETTAATLDAPPGLLNTVPEGEFPNSAALPPPVDMHPKVRIKTNHGSFVVKLDRENAPISVENFLDNYVDEGFYNGTLVHYVQKGTMLIAGGIDANKQKKETKPPIFNEAFRTGSNRRGTIAMSRDPGYVQSATSQFFINLADNAALDHKGVETPEDYGYAVFGEVVEGIEVLDKIGNVQVHQAEGFPNTPVEPVVIQGIERLGKR